MRRVLILLPTTTYRAADFLVAAQALGVEVIVGSEQAHVLDGLANSGVIGLPMHRPEVAADAIVEFAGELPIDAIVPVDDGGVVTAAIAAERLGLAHNRAGSVEVTRNKAAMRRCLAKDQVPQPDFVVVSEHTDLATVADGLGYPLVVKPLQFSASRGVIRADNRQQAKHAAARIRAMLPESQASIDRALMIERFIPGTEIAIEGLLRGGQLETLAVFDKPDPLNGPFFEESIYVTPSRLPGRQLAAVADVTSRAVASLGLTEGPVHAELRVSGDEVNVIEVAARSIGGLCSRALQFGLGVSLESLILRHALDLPIRDTNATHAAAGVMMLPIPSAGVLVGIDGQQEARLVPAIVALEITISFGSWVDPLPEGDRYLGFLFARGDSPGEVELALRRAHEKLKVLINPGHLSSEPKRQSV